MALPQSPWPPGTVPRRFRKPPQRSQAPNGPQVVRRAKAHQHKMIAIMGQSFCTQRCQIISMIPTMQSRSRLAIHHHPYHTNAAPSTPRAAIK